MATSKMTEDAYEDEENYLFRINIFDDDESLDKMRKSNPIAHNVLSLPEEILDGRKPVRECMKDILQALEYFVKSSGPPVIQLGRNHPDSTPDTFATLRPIRSSHISSSNLIDEGDARKQSFSNNSVNPNDMFLENSSFVNGQSTTTTTNSAGENISFMMPDELILRELADIRRLLLQRFLNQPDNLQNIYPQDEILGLLVLTNNGDPGEPGEPPPHFPVGDWVWSECKVCLEFRWLYYRICCNFPVCADCLREYFTSKVNEGIVKIECCNPRCHVFVHRDEVSARLEPHVKEKYRLYLLQANLDPYSKTCPRCNHVFTVSKLASMKNTKSHPERSRIKCEECQLVWCFSCHSPWHYQLTCKQFRKGDRLLKSWAEEIHHGQRNAQRCPKCQIFIQRTSGCDHMHCSLCKTDFCYRCGDQLRKLRFFGDHYSQLSIFGCKYRYKANHPIQRKFIRGAVFGGKLLIAPIVGTLGACAGVVAMGLGIFALPVYGGIKLYRHYEAKKHHPRVSRLPLAVESTEAYYPSSSSSSSSFSSASSSSFSPPYTSSGSGPVIL